MPQIDVGGGNCSHRGWRPLLVAVCLFRGGGCNTNEAGVWSGLYRTTARSSVVVVSQVALF